MRRKLGRLLAFGLIICLMAACGTAAAESMHAEVENPSLEVEVLLGYDEQITYGKAVPVRVTVRNTGAEDLNGSVAVNAYATEVKYDRFVTEIFVPAGSERTVVLPVAVQTRQDIFTAEVLQGEKVLASVNASPEGVINPSAMMVGVLSSRPRNLANLDITQENDTLYRYEYWQTVPLTPETLPEEKKLLDSFGMIVLDDVAPDQLTDKQRQALLDWIRNGRVMICGGGTSASGNLALLGEMTDLRAGDITVSDGVVPALENYTVQRDSGHKPEIALAVLEGEKPLVSDDQGNGLIWRKTAGAGSVYVLAWEAGDASLNTESVLHTFLQQMLLQEDGSLYNDILYMNGNMDADYIPDDDLPLSLRNPMPAEAAVIAACLLIACAAWLILRKHGKTQWMWAVLPLLSLAAAGAAVLFAGSSSMNNPVAAVAVNLVQDKSGSTTRYTGVSAAAPRPGLHSYSMEGELLDVLIYDDPYYYMDDDEDNDPEEPSTLRAVYRTGENREAAVNAETPWQSVSLASVRPEEDCGQVSAEIWMEKDGLHGSVRNDMAFALKEGAVVCEYGFVKVPALAPGEEREFALYTDTAGDPYNPVFEDGKMFMNASVSMYQVVYQLFFGPDGERTDSRESALAGMINSAAERFTAGDRRKGGQGSICFIYCAETEEDFTAPVRADGRETEGRAGITMLNAEIRYLTVGKTGVVFHAPGMDKAVRCEIDGQGMPTGDMQEEPSGRYYDYYSLDEIPTFRFSPENISDVEISRLVIGVEEWYLNDLHCYVLNTRLKTWVEITPNTSLQRPEQFLDGEGSLYCQFRPVNPGDYTSIPAPTLTVEGMLKTK